MSYIFNIVDFRLIPLLQDFPFFLYMLDSYPCNSHDEKKHILGVYGSRMSYIFNIVDFRLSPFLQDVPYFDICWTRIPVIHSMKQNIYWGSMALE